MTVSNGRLEELVGMQVSPFCETKSATLNEWQEIAKELLALRKAFSEPFCFTDDAGVSLRSHKSNFECSPVKFGNKDIPLYRKPNLPL